ncbi:MAG TPA: hypothetical protein VFB78_12760 [Acidimicrobiales bacterium]|nr:hypothetical protein [Acidimicrobiales bacterium]
MRKLVVLLAALCLASSCGSGGGANAAKDKKDGQYGSDFLTEDKATVPPPSTTAPARPTTTARHTSPTLGRTPKVGAGPSSSNPYSAADKQVGFLAGLVLQPAPAKKVVIEIQAQDGVGPRPAALAHVVAILKRVTGGKTIETPRVALPAGPTTWNYDQLADYADRFGKAKSGGDTVVIKAQWVHGSAPSAGTLGGAHRADLLTMFADRYKDHEGLAVTVDDLETAIITHEFGHMLGLVDLWLNTGRGDYKSDPAPGGHHSPNKRSVMYYAVETSDLAIVFSGGKPPTEFDADDEADLAAIRAGAAYGSKR